MTLFVLSAMKMFPRESTATPSGPFKAAAVARPPLPLPPPAIVMMIDVAAIGVLLPLKAAVPL